MGGSRNGGQEIVLRAILNFCLSEQEDLVLAAVRAVGGRVARLASLMAIFRSKTNTPEDKSATGNLTKG